MRQKVSVQMLFVVSLDRVKIKRHFHFHVSRFFHREETEHDDDDKTVETKCWCMKKKKKSFLSTFVQAVTLSQSRVFLN